MVLTSNRISSRIWRDLMLRIILSINAYSQLNNFISLFPFFHVASRIKHGNSSAELLHEKELMYHNTRLSIVSACDHLAIANYVAFDVLQAIILQAKLGTELCTCCSFMCSLVNTYHSYSHIRNSFI